MRAYKKEILTESQRSLNMNANRSYAIQMNEFKVKLKLLPDLVQIFEMNDNLICVVMLC